MNEKNISSYLKKGGLALGIIMLLWIVTKLFSGGGGGESEYKIARDGTWYPEILQGKEKNMLGFTNELLLTIANEEGFKLELYNKGYTGLFIGLENGSYDAVISSLVPSSANQAYFLFSDPIYLTGPVLIVLKNERESILGTHERLVIGQLHGYQPNISFSKYPDAVLRGYESQELLVQALINDRIDAIIMDAMPAYNITQGFYSGQLVVGTKPLNENGLRLIAMKTLKGERLVSTFNQGLTSLRKEGRFKQILDSWQLIDTETLSN